MRLEELPWGAAEFAVGHRQVLGLKSMGMIPNISNPSCSVPCAALGVLCPALECLGQEGPGAPGEAVEVRKGLEQLLERLRRC